MICDRDKKSTNDATTMDSMKTDIEKDIAEVELRMRLRKFDEENIILREELTRAEELIANLERQCKNLENQLDRYTKKYQQLERENDEQKDKLDEMTRNEKSYISAYQKSTKKYESLSKQLEAAEIEIQAIQPLKEEMEKISKEKRDCIKQVARLQEEFCEKEEECEKLKVTIAELQDTNSSMKESYEYTICHLREKNRQLADENMELQSWSAFQGERSSIPIADGCYPHSTPYKLEQMSLENSLYAELQASGFTAECSSRSSCRLELEEELDYYDTVISATLEQLDRVIENFTATSTDGPRLDLPHTEDTGIRNIEALKRKVAFLLRAVTEKITSGRSSKNSGTQLRADYTDYAAGSTGQFGITSFRAGMLTRAYQCLKPDTNLRSTASQDVSDNVDDPFLKVIRENANVVLDRNIIEVIDPLVEELDRIIEQTINSPVVYKDLAASGNPRYRSVYTLPSNSQEVSSPGVEENAKQASSYQSSRWNSLDDAASGDGLTRVNICGKSAEFNEARSTRNVPDIRESPPHTEETSRPPGEMPKVSSALRMDSKTLEVTPEEETSTKNLQAPEVTVTSPLTSPRRKFSVYYRSFDVVEVREPNEDDQDAPCLEVRRSPSSSPVRDGEKKTGDLRNDRTQNDAPRYLFSHSYRSARNDSDSSNSCSPQKQFSDDPPDDEANPIVQPVPRKIYLAPTRLKLTREVGPSETVDAKNTRDRAPTITNSSGWDASSSFSTLVDGDRCEKDDDIASVHSSSTFVIDKCKTSARDLSTSVRSIPHNRIDSAEIADPENPHSGTASVRRDVGDQPTRVEPSVDSQMSSREDTSAGEDSECESAKPSDRCVDGRVTMGASEADQTANAALPLVGSPMKKMLGENVVQSDGKARREARDRNLFDAKQERRQRRLLVRRSLSEGENDNNNGRTLCRCRRHDGPRTAPLIQTDDQLKSFPSLTSVHLQESGIANLPDSEFSSRENLSEFELQKRYTAFSLCLCTDRLTLSRRMEVSLRQRDQSERNLACEVQKMQQDIQELAPLCTDRESVERVERVRHQLDMVARCAHRVSCAAETLGAMHQEHRVSRAVFVADRYLQLLQSRCEKLVANVAETKQILIENNIVIEEISGELGDDLPRIRYRSGTPANNRMMDTVRQRNSVSGRVTLRRPSLSYETSKWENERLGRTDSSSSIGELRGIFEHAESRRSSREENNNMLRLSQSNSQSIINCAIIDDEIATSPKQETCSELLSVNEEDLGRDCRPCATSQQSLRLRGIVTSWRVILCSVLIFFLGFYVNRVVSAVNACGVSDPSDEWLIEQILKRYFRTRNVMPHPA
ncbi:PREDICTED: uncharacterized protein LOC106741772 isoform X2 [Dinoponera quadriceps]|uniref:Uncharacterized protein LOC106741772 isoform X2 n=1 Tax=Dinoponera quadriceps TaxID=609295 RepID=A0A6P3WUP2_DINQU|nr:PREDICTED: uncharacterized protein LOC106741772 isoform X2 [Dinoponera quadriceps]